MRYSGCRINYNTFFIRKTHVTSAFNLKKYTVAVIILLLQLIAYVYFWSSCTSILIIIGRKLLSIIIMF